MVFKIGDVVTLNNDTRGLGCGTVDKLCATGAIVVFDGFPESVWYSYKSLQKYDDWEHDMNQVQQEIDSRASYDPPTFSDASDAVESPNHYTHGEIECIDYLKDNMPYEAFLGFLEGNCKKYMHRFRYKQKPLEDLKKARRYLDYLLAELED